MMKSPVMKIVCMVVWLITALYAFNALTAYFGFNYMQMIVDQDPEGMLPKVVLAIVGISGLISLIMWVMSLTKCKSCGTSNCSCK